MNVEMFPLDAIRKWKVLVYNKRLIDEIVIRERPKRIAENRLPP